MQKATRNIIILNKAKDDKDFTISVWLSKDHDSHQSLVVQFSQFYV